MRSITILLLLILPATIASADIRTHPKYKEWVLALSDGSDEKRLEVLQSLSKLDLDTSPLFAVMRKTLRESESPEVAIAIAKHASGPRVDAKELLPDLLKAVRRGVLASERVILLAAKHDDPALAELLRRHLHVLSENPEDRDNLYPVLLELLKDDYPQRWLPAFVACLDEPNEEIRQSIFEVLHLKATHNESEGTFTKRAYNRTKVWQSPTVVAALEKGVRPFLCHTDPKIRAKAAELLWYAKPVLADEFFAQYFADYLDGSANCEIMLCYDAFLQAFPKLVERLLASHKVADGAHDLIHHLCGKYILDEARTPAIWVVRRHLRDKRPEIRRTLLRVLMHNMPDNEQARREFVRYLDDPERRVRLAACEGLLEKPNKHTTAIVRVLREALNMGDTRDREEALRLLALVGPEGRTLLPDLLRLAKHPSPRLRAGTGFALFKIAPKMQTTYLPLFVDILTTDTWAMQKPVLLALPDIGPPAKHLVPALQKLLREHLHDYERANPIANAIIWISPEHAKATRELLYSKRDDP